MKVTHKDSINEGSDRSKRKKITETITTKVAKDVYANVINFEENEARQRSVEKDSQLFHQTCEELRKTFDTVAVAKRTSNNEQSKQEIFDKRIEGSLLFVLLKKLNRLDKVRFRDNREALQKEKLRVDSNRLQLQNLLYEADHLNKEIQRCYQFKSQDEEIHLVTEDEFYENAPDTVARPDKTKNDEHAKRLARLEWELQQRKELSALYNELLKEKDKVAQDINTKTDRMESLLPRLQGLLKATRPLQEALDLPIEKEWEIKKTSKYLCRPLYLLYANLHAYISAIEDKYLKVTINGNEEEAKQIDEFDDKEIKDKENVGSEQDSDGEDNENEIEYEVTSKSHRRLSKSAIKEQKIQNLYKTHPLTITLSVYNKENLANYFDVKFTYLQTLGFVTVKCEIYGYEASGVSGDILDTSSILNSLLNNDIGEVSPNPKTKYQLNELNVSETTFYQTISDKCLGKPYSWAQNMCGLDFIGVAPNHSSAVFQTSPSMNLKENLSVKALPEIIKLIRFRWESRVLLQKQIKMFEDNSIDFATTIKSSYSIRISSNLVQCTAITCLDYLNQLSLSHSESSLDDDDCNVNENDLFYCVVLTRSSAKLECYINIPCDYPKSLALWKLQLHWNGKQNAANNSAIREMEFWINSTVRDTKNTAKLLEKQMERALCCLDIYLETEGLMFNTAEFVPDKTFIKSFRGRQRSRPFRLVDSNDGCCVFTQIQD